MLSPLDPLDPPRVGPYWLDARLLIATSGIAYLAHDDAAADRVMVVRLSEGASADPAARDRFAGLINKLHIDTVLARGGQSQSGGRWGKKFIEQSTPPQMTPTSPEPPWAALAYERSSRDVSLADHLLSEVELRTLEQQGAPSGPQYRHYWLHQSQPRQGTIWPLPWPGRAERAGWKTLLISWLLMLVLAALAVLIAILLFHNQPPMSPPPPTGGSSGTSTESSSQSPSPSEATDSSSPSPTDQSESPSSSPSNSGSESGSPSPSNGETSGSASPSPTTGGTESGGGQESPRSRL